MTIVTRAAYRGYQGVFRIAAAFLDFTPPELLEGPGSVRRLPELIKSKGVDKVLLVTDKGILGLRLLDGLFERLTAAGVGYVHIEGVQPQPNIQNHEHALEAHGHAG